MSEKKEATPTRHHRTGSIDSPKPLRPTALPTPSDQKSHKGTANDMAGIPPSLETLQGYYKMRLRQLSS